MDSSQLWLAQFKPNPSPRKATPEELLRLLNYIIFSLRNNNEQRKIFISCMFIRHYHWGYQNFSDETITFSCKLCQNIFTQKWVDHVTKGHQCYGLHCDPLLDSKTTVLPLFQYEYAAYLKDREWSRYNPNASISPLIISLKTYVPFELPRPVLPLLTTTNRYLINQVIKNETMAEIEAEAEAANILANIEMMEDIEAATIMMDI